MSVKVPKLINQVWVGPNEYPELYVGYAESLAKTNPGWDMILHAEHPELCPNDGPWKEVRHLDFDKMYVGPLRKIYNDHCNGMQKHVLAADVARIEVLLRNGGVYFDNDVLGINPIDDPLQHVTLGASEEYFTHQVGNFFLVSTPGHPALWQVIRNATENTRLQMSKREKSFEPLWTCGPGPTHEAMRMHVDNVVFTSKIFCGWDPHLEIKVEDIEKIDFPWMTKTVHVFEGSWYKYAWDKTPLTEDLNEGLRMRMDR